ncbi:MAG TPA: arsenate reductase (glutaredoxin) [Mycobacterium sp.]|jgi:arsenate reductase
MTKESAQADDRRQSNSASVIYHNPRCSTSRNALALLRDKGVEPKVVEYLKTPPTRGQLADMIHDAGIPVREAVRKREAPYAELGLDGATDDELLDAMAANPILIQRPFVVTPKGTRLARPVDVLHEIL